MEMYEILVPTIHPVTGNPIRTKFHKIWDEKVRAISGGLTILHPAKGQWVSPEGTLFNERMIPVRIACDENQIKEIARITLSYYKQEAVMYYKVSNEVTILYGEKDGKANPQTNQGS